MSFTSGQILTASQLNVFTPGTKIKNANGSASDPTYTFDGDANTGMFRSGTDALGFSTGGSARVTIASDGDVGINTTSPSAKLDVNGRLLVQADGSDILRLRDTGATDTGGYISFEQSAGTRIGYVGYPNNDDLYINNQMTSGLIFLRTNDTTRMVIASDGDVGIGTTTPESILHLNPGTDQTPDTNGVGHIMIDGNGYTSFVTMDATGTWIGNNSSSRAMILATNETARLTVASDGDVGIGTTSPGQRLHVNSGTTDNTAVFESTDAVAYISVKDNSTSGNNHVAIGAVGDELRLRAGNVNIVTGETNGTVKANTGDFYAAASGKTMLALAPPTGTGNDAEWAAPLGIYILRRNSSLTAEKENISADLGTHLTADMIDQVVPKMWNRINAPGYPEIGPLAEDMDAISPFLAARGTTAENVPFLTGINKTAYLSLLVLAVKDLRTRVAALESA
tara:strand:- start:402 stop:1760 length:1359 start_codon:yes stop_codon:yes gene_type:complete